MPSRRLLAVLLALAAAVAGAAGATQNAPAPLRNPLAGDAAAVSSGRVLFNQTCQACHGPAGEGSDRGPALAVATFVHGNTDADLFRSVRAGIRGTQMPSFAALSDTAIWQLVAFVRALQPAMRGDGSQAPSIGDAA